jgi:hypothetical protein
VAWFSDLCSDTYILELKQSIEPQMIFMASQMSIYATISQIILIHLRFSAVDPHTSVN